MISLINHGPSEVVIIYPDNMGLCGFIWNYTWWLIPGIVSGLVHPTFFSGISRLNPPISRVN